MRKERKNVKEMKEGIEKGWRDEDLRAESK